MKATTRAVTAAIAAGVVPAVLFWPTSDCFSTLILALPGQPDPNIRSCTSVLGLPSSRVAAIVGSLLVATVVYAIMRRRMMMGSRSQAGDRQRRARPHGDESVKVVLQRQ